MGIVWTGIKGGIEIEVGVEMEMKMEEVKGEGGGRAWCVQQLSRYLVSCMTIIEAVKKVCVRAAYK